MKTYLSKSKKSFLQYLKIHHEKSDSNKIIEELNHLLKFEKDKIFENNNPPPTSLKGKFKFSLNNKNYLLLHDNSINLNDIIIFSLSYDFNENFRTFKVLNQIKNIFYFLMISLLDIGVKNQLTS